MRAEFDTLVRKGVFGKGRPFRKGDNSIGTMFVLKAKSDQDGRLSRIKARLTVMGNQETQDLLSYAPVMLLTTMRLLIAMQLLCTFKSVANFNKLMDVAKPQH